LAGVYLLLFVPTVDVLFFQNPMVEDPHWVASYLPGRYAAEVAVDAGLSAGVALEPVGRAVGYLLTIAAVAAIAYRRATRSG